MNTIDVHVVNTISSSAFPKTNALGPGPGERLDLPDQSNIVPDSGADGIMLAVLNSVENNQKMTQRSLAKELGIAVGLANAYVKRCIQKGFVKISQVPPRRYTYYLTPQGFSEKSRLTVKYLRVSFDFFRTARNQLDGLLALCAAQGHERVVLAGAGELGEIAWLCARDRPLEVLGFVDPDRAGQRLHGLPIVADATALGQPTAFIVTDVNDPQETFERLIEVVPHGRVFVPKILNISRQAPEAPE